jgi:uncharacterized protein with PIN domain
MTSEPTPDPSRSQPGEQKFLCDAMLGRLARWLRAAGYDATLATGAESDRELIRTAIAEGRVFLTLDRGFRDRKAARGHALVLGDENVSAQARELKRALGVDWLFRPFSRCVVDNTPLRSANPAERAALPLRVRDRSGPIAACPRCGRIYWTGDQHTRMRERLERWDRG